MNRSHRQWASILERLATRSRYHTCVAPDQHRGTTPPWGELCWSCTPRCQKIQGKGLPRTPTIKSLPACRFPYRSRRTMEPRNNLVLEPPGTQQRHLLSAALRPSFTTALIARWASHTHPCGHARLCVVFAFPAHGRLPQPRGPPAQRATPCPLPQVLHHPQPSPTLNG